MKFISTLLISLFFSNLSHSFEVDNFTNRYSPLKDSRDAMNEDVNKRLQDAAESANGLVNRAVNRVSKGANQCDKEDLYEEVHDEVGGWIVGSLESFAEDSDKIQRHQDDKNSIYYRDGQMMAGSGVVLKLFGTHSSINLNGHYVGTDKFGHFFDQGYEYYKEFKKSSSYAGGIEKALKYGKELESGKYGTTTTGVFSYGDLMANYSGLQFWLSLTDGANPLFKCVQGQWKQVRKFDFAQYVNSGWDEAINCSEFRDSTKRGIEKNQEALEKKAAKRGKKDRYLCPVSADQCKKLSKQYKKYENYLMSYDCRNPLETDKPGQRVNAQVPNSKVSPSKSSSKTTGGVR